MAPAQTRKRKSDEMATPEASTPVGSPAAKKMKITELQKQALIDNLQLEITERARRLRAQYAIQCKDLRSRIERRVHRIPIAMRNMTMAELMAKHDETKKPAASQTTRAADRPLPPAPQVNVPVVPSPVRLQQRQAQLPRPRKRKSSEIHIASDKENDQEPTTSAPEVLPIAKNNKRAKTNAANRPASRTQKTRSSKEATGGVLSPRSHNSRTLPRSPIKDLHHPISPTKPYTSQIARPISPLKPNSPLKSAATAASHAISASVHGMLESARSRATQASKATRSANTLQTLSKDAIPARTTSKAATGTRAVSAQSNHSVSTEASTTSTSTVVTKSKRTGRVVTNTITSETGKMGPPASKPRRVGTTKAATASKAATSVTAAAKKASASVTTSKQVVATEPASTTTTTGRRILRKRN